MQLSVLLAIFLELFVTFCECGLNDVPIVELPFGKIRGSRRDGYFSFNNIPYAEPPVGERRFEPPSPFHGSWTEEKDGTQSMTTCVHFERYMPSSGSEDCLYLHVVTPAIACDKMYPVRVQIHGGGFMGGSPDNMDTTIQVKRGIVIVTMGYRLGPLGFLSTGDSIISGNNGLKDQRLAIMWVKANINSFCGDANNILLAGASAGGASTHMHLLHKPTENYVNAVASHNGVATCPWAFQTMPQQLCTSFSSLLNCSANSMELKRCLQSKSIEELQEATWALQYYKNNPFTVFAPVVESPESEDPFIVEHPLEIMNKGNAANVTWLVGYTEREGSCNAASFLALDENGCPDIRILNERWTDLAPYLLFFNNTMNVQERQVYSILMKDIYLGDKDFSEENYRLLENMYTDVLFNNDIRTAVELHRKYNPGRVYVYFYSYPHTFGLGNLLSSRKDVSFGADHMADSIFTIPMMPLKPSSLSGKDMKVSELLNDMYLTWANTGVLRFGEIDLPLNTPIDDAILSIDEHCYSVNRCSTMDVPSCKCYSYD